MPAIGSHMSRAHRIAVRLRLPEIDDERGSFYLGATAPDVRVLTRRDRRETHFFDLDDLTNQDSAARMFEAYPDLARPERLDEARTAFVAGYLTHLVMDETFIDEIYRPYFGVYSEIDDDPMSDVLDRAMQYELDRRERSDDPEAMQVIQQALEAYEPVPGVPFIETEYLDEWRVISAEVAALPPDYGRFRRMMSRHLEDPNITEEDLDRWAANPEVLIKQAFQIVSEERMEQFWRDVDDRMTERVRSYLR
jgi:hypothetical protein